MYLEKNQYIIEKAFEMRAQKYCKKFGQISRKLDAEERNVAISMKYLYATMPRSDIFMYDYEVYREFAVIATEMYEKNPYTKSLPEEIFLQYVLFHRVNEEEIRSCRRLFNKEILLFTETVSAIDMSMAVNLWCAENGKYCSTDDRTISARAFYERGCGRCGEESVFYINALRSVGIPARQVYVPGWSHCDDNHAWVEIYIDGKWYFTGACEPAEILNRGWFNKASSRAMLIHSRFFGTIGLSDEEQIIGAEGGVTILNQTGRYVDTVVLNVHTKPDENLELKVFNENTLITIASVKADDNGEISIELGKGTVLLEWKKDGFSGRKLVNTQMENDIVFSDLSEEHGDGEWEWNFYAPEAGDKNTAVMTPEQEKICEKNKACAERKLQKKIEAFKNDGIGRFRVYAEKIGEKELGECYLRQLSVKDQADITYRILKSQFCESLTYKTMYEDEVYVSWVLKSRIEDEVASEYKKDIREFFKDKEREVFKKNPVGVWQWIIENIEEDGSEERLTVLTTPGALLEVKKGTRRSMRLLFISIMRTIGIPARLSNISGSMEYYENGQFRSVLEEERPSVKIYFSNDKNISLTDAHNRNYKITNGFAAVPQGRYEVICGRRLPNGNVYATFKDFSVDSGETKTIDIKERAVSAKEMLSQNSLPDFQLMSREGVMIDAEDLLKGNKILLWLSPGKEPTEHILNELIEQASSMKRYCCDMMIILKDLKKANDDLLRKMMDVYGDIAVYEACSSKGAEEIARAMYLEPDLMPLVVMTQEKYGIYGVSGYNVGTGKMLCALRLCMEEKENEFE